MVNLLTVEQVSATGNRLTVKFRCEGKIKRFFLTNKFIAEYTTSIQDVPEQILTIPFLATVAPITWANQAELNLKTADATYLNSLCTIRETLQKFYPEMRFVNKIQAEKAVTTPTKKRSRHMILFSGGVDSIATFIRHKNEKPILVSIQEADFQEYNKAGRETLSMNVTDRYLKDFSETTKTPIQTVRSNWLFIPDSFWLNIYRKELAGGWYAKVMHGLAFSGLCAPLAYVENADKLYIASSFTSKTDIPWGSHPDIDNNVRWTGTKVEHDGYELTRQQKILLIADYIRNVNPHLQINSCSPGQMLGKNCSHCEKCSRTILGLELAGIDPNKHGFQADAETFQQIQRKIESHAWQFREDEVYMWTDLQENADETQELPHQEARMLVDWLRNVDVKSLKEKSIKSRRADQFLKLLPYSFFRLAEKLYIKITQKFYH